MVEVLRIEADSVFHQEVGCILYSRAGSAHAQGPLVKPSL